MPNESSVDDRVLIVEESVEVHKVGEPRDVISGNSGCESGAVSSESSLEGKEGREDGADDKGEATM